MVRMLVPCGACAAVRASPCWGWPGGHPSQGLPADNGAAIKVQMKSVRAVDPVILSVQIWPPCLCWSWKWWVVHSFSWGLSGIWHSSVVRVNLWSFPGVVMQMGIWTRNHEEHLQKLPISQHLYPLVSKSCKSLYAFEPSLRPGWILWGQNLSPPTLHYPMKSCILQLIHNDKCFSLALWSCCWIALDCMWCHDCWACPSTAVLGVVRKAHLPSLAGGEDLYQMMRLQLPGYRAQTSHSQHLTWWDQLILWSCQLNCLKQP